MNEEYRYIIVDESQNIANRQFETGTVERVISILIWPLCFLYASMIFVDGEKWEIMFGAFTLFFLVFGEIMYWGVKSTWESKAILIMTVITAASVFLPIGHVWEKPVCMFFTHLFAVYWVLCRSDKLTAGETSHMMVLDGITGFIIMPFKNFLLNIQTIITVFKFSDKKRNKKAIPFVLGASLAGIVLFYIAISYLMHADDNYSELMQKIGGVINIDIDELFFCKLVLTMLISTYLYGLLGGCYRETREKIVSRGDNVKKIVESMRKVPGSVWVIFITLFSLFYVLFFVMQGHYLFDAFIMKLPQEFTYSQYARKGFGDMCGVMIVNFILLWLSTRTGSTMEKPVKTASLILNGESMIFALIAFLKLAMYINAYGFTPLRFESIWAATVLMFACICVMINMLTGRKTAKVWFMGSAATLAVLCVI